MHEDLFGGTPEYMQDVAPEQLFGDRPNRFDSPVHQAWAAGVDMGTQAPAPSQTIRVSDGKWTYNLEPDGDLIIVQGPPDGNGRSLINQRFRPGNAQHSAMLANLMAVSGQQAAAILRTFPAAAQLRAGGPEAPPPEQPRSNTPAPLQPFVPSEPGLTERWWFWPAVGLAAAGTVFAGVTVIRKRRARG